MSDASKLIRPGLVENASAPRARATRFPQNLLAIRHGDHLAEPQPAEVPPSGADLAAGDPAAFEQLFLTYVDRLCRYVYKFVKSWAEAEELVQDLFLTLWQRRATLVDVQEIDAYLYAAARHRAVNHLRRRRVTTRKMGLLADPDAELVPSEADAIEIQAALQRAVDTLTPRQREVLLLRWRDQASYDEIMARLGIREQTVGTHLRRALEHLRKVLPSFL